MREIRKLSEQTTGRCLFQTVLLSILTCALPAPIGQAADLESKLLPLIENHEGTVAVTVKHLETGESFSGAMTLYPDTFNELIINQVRVGERSGTLSETLNQVTTQVLAHWLKNS